MHCTAMSIWSAPEMTITGKPLRSGARFIAANTSSPVITGISMSRSTRSKEAECIFATASRPSTASTTFSKPI